MKVRAPSAEGRYFDVKKLIHGASLNTVCEEARCPNIAECWGKGTATFQILGDTCTRACRYCYVNSGRPEHAPDPLEPLRLAQAAAQMGLRHVVVTSVDRDDVADRGAGHFAATIRALKAKLPGCSVEVLTPDFLGAEEQALATVLGARPEVFSHNIETVRRLHRRMRGAKASYDGALHLLRRAKEVAGYPVLTKTGIIAGLGETNDEIVETMRELRATASTSSRSASTCSLRASTPRSIAGSTPTSSAGCANRVRRSDSARCSPARSSGRATAQTSRSTPPTPASASSRTESRRRSLGRCTASPTRKGVRCPHGTEGDDPRLDAPGRRSRPGSGGGRRTKTPSTVALRQTSSTHRSSAAGTTRSTPTRAHRASGYEYPPPGWVTPLTLSL